MDEKATHHSADVQSKAVGAGTTIWQFCVVLPGARIGANCNVCSHCFIENDVVIGNSVTIKNGVSLWDGIRIEDNVFIGPNVTFTNDKYPRSKQRPAAFATTLIRARASIGANATILPGITIGEGSMVGAGAVVTRSVPPNAIVAGNPARICGYTSSLAPTAAIQKKQIQERPAREQLAVRGVTLHYFPEVEDIRGRLTVGNFDTDIPFTPKRYFIVHGVPSKETRGEHAHRRCHQFLVCVEGSCAVVVDNAHERCEVLLNAPSMGLHIPPMVWGIQYKYTADAKLMVFASDPYDPADYVRSYADFLTLRKSTDAAGS